MKRWYWTLALGVFVFGCKSGEEATETATVQDALDQKPAASGSDGGTGGFAGVQALLGGRCMPCHGENGKEGIDVRTYESLMKGGEHGPIIKPGDAAGSMIIHALKGENGVKQMPMNATPLPAEDIAKIETWINAGAKNE